MEDARLLEKTFEAFCARGAALGPEEKEKYRKLSSELSLLSLTFDQNALKDKNRYELLLTKKTNWKDYRKAYAKLPHSGLKKRKNRMAVQSLGPKLRAFHALLSFARVTGKDVSGIYEHR